MTEATSERAQLADALERSITLFEEALAGLGLALSAAIRRGDLSHETAVKIGSSFADAAERVLRR